MNLHSLRYFVEVARTLNFTKASKNLFVSQPGISQQIHLLEESLGIKLLNRTTRKVELTEEGRYLFEKTFPSLQEIDKTISDLTDLHTFPTLIKIATIPSAASLFLPDVLKQLHRNHPEIEVSIKETTSAEIKRLVSEREHHLGFIRTDKDFQENKTDQFDYYEFERSPIKAVVSSKHRLANEESINLSELNDDFFLHFDPKQSTSLYRLLEDAFNYAGFKPKTLCTGSELLTISNIISSNLAVTLLPKDMLELVISPQIKALHLKDVHLESSIAAIWNNDDYLSVSTKILLHTLEELNAVTHVKVKGH